MSNFFLEYKNLVSMRHRTGVGGVLLGALIIATPLLSWGSASSWLNTLLGLWQGAIVLLLLPEVKGLTVKIFKDSLAFKLTGFLLFFSLIGMLVFNFDALMETRTWIYCIQPFFFIAMVSWFSTDTDAKMLFICICKIISVGFVTLVLFCLLVGINDLSITRRQVDLFLYNNIRQYNFDLAFGFMAGAMVWLFVRGRWRLQAALSLFFCMLGFASIFTEGRGQILSLIVFCGAAFFSSRNTLIVSVQSKAIFSFVLGAVLLTVLYPAVFDILIGRSISGDMNSVSSKRWDIWKHALAAWVGAEWSMPRILFGLGPESFRLLMPYPGIVQPHNSVIQMLMEFGILGLAFLMLLFFKVGQCLYYSCRAKEVEPLPLLVSCALLGMLIYSFTDGIIYHGVPVIICILMGAYLFAKMGGESRSKGGGAGMFSASYSG